MPQPRTRAPLKPLDPTRRVLARAGRVVLEAVSRPAWRGSYAQSGGIPRRGVALLMVLTYLVMMSAMVVTTAFNSRVTLSIASNHRDELKAYYKARSALNLSRLILSFQFELERQPEIAKAMRNSRFQVYQITDLLLEPFKTGAVTIEGDAGENVVDYDLKSADEEGTTGLGDDSGNYTVSIVPEEGRININRLAAKDGNKIGLFDFCLLVTPEQYDPLFDTREDPDGVKAEREDVISAIIDWVDPDTDRTQLNQQCEIEGSSGDEDGRYARGGVGPNKREYKNKNAPFTTIDELFMVEGVTDEFMEAFRDSLTVYPVDRVNVNVATARVFYALLCNAVDMEKTGVPLPEGQWACKVPEVNMAVLALAVALEGYQQFVNSPLLLLSYYLQGNPEVIPGATPRGTVVPFRHPNEFLKIMQAIQMNPMELTRFVLYSPTAFQLVPDPQMLETIAPLVPVISFNRRKLFATITTEGPKIFRITAIGEYDGTQKTLEAVVEISREGEKFLYWREY